MKTCEQCKKEYIGRGKRFCSDSCRYAFMRENGLGRGAKSGKNVSCFMCGKVVWRKGYLLRKFDKALCSKKCQWAWNAKNLHENFAAENSPSWKGGCKMKDGRVRMRIGSGKKILRARKVVGEIREGAIVHHIDENPSNDSPENLFVFRHQSAHTRWHHFLRRHGLKGLLTSNI